MLNRIAKFWHEDYSNIKLLARHLVLSGELQTAEELIEFMEKPWKWHESWEAMRQPHSLTPQTDPLKY